MPSRRELANAIRALAMDAVQKANSGHPGMPMGMADIAEVLWRHYLHHNPANPHWINRDRFILSNGHGSMLQYALLHLTGYELSLEELKNFRQLGSKTPGHPEFGHTVGVEATTGPLGQGLANAVGMAITERILATQFNRPNHEIIDHYTWVFAGDGCLMEGISHEACSLAGTLQLGKLIVFYDDNGISIDGEVKGWFTDDTAERFNAYHWHVIGPIDGHDPEAIDRAIKEAQHVKKQPSLIICKTIIGFGSPNKEGTESSHGSPLGETEVQLARQQLNWHYPPFVIPTEIYAAWDARAQGQRWQNKYDQIFQAYQQAFPELAQELLRRFNRQLPASFNLLPLIHETQKKAEKIASRKASQNVLDYIGPQLAELFGGSADLASSNLTLWKGVKIITAENFDGAYLHYGVREFAMGAISNGIANYGGFIPYDATFLVFSEYMFNAVRMSALSKAHVVHIFTHDSIGLGEDGPTHQPIEQLEALRAIPNLHTWRPADSVETVVAWDCALQRHDGPTALALSRQNLPVQARNEEQLKLIARGGYILFDCQANPELILIATGSEVALAIEAAHNLAAKYAVRVVSMPCTTVFDQQSLEYRESVLPHSIRKRLAIEAASVNGWYKYVGLDGLVLGMHRYGESAKAEDLFKYFGFTQENVCKLAQQLLA